MSRPKHTTTYERQWYDLAARFEEGLRTLATPPFSTIAKARAFRFRFYGFRAMAVREAPGMYPHLENIVARILTNDDGSYSVLFAERDATEVGTMLGRILSQNESKPCREGSPESVLEKALDK